MKSYHKLHTPTFDDVLRATAVGSALEEPVHCHRTVQCLMELSGRSEEHGISVAAHAVVLGEYVGDGRAPHPWQFSMEYPSDDVEEELSFIKNLSIDFIEKFRRDFIKRNHPDRVPAEYRDRATQRMAVANSMFDELRRKSGLVPSR